MNTLRIQTRDGRRTDISADTLATLTATLRGRLLTEDAPGYDAARRIWNGMIDRKPALIARCLGASDVVAAVNFAREHELLFSIRGAGHNIAGTAVADGGLMIDLIEMQGIRVDPEARRVWVQPGTTWADVDRETQLHGLVVPGGIVSTTGVSGFTLGGGFGWLTRKWGYTVDLLRSVELVTPDGQFLNVTAESHPDLFWALCGGGGNFGVVTGYEFDAKPLGPTVMAGIVFYSFERAVDLLRHFREITGNAPNELACLFAVRTAPAAPFIPEEQHGKLIVGIAMNYAGPLDDAMRYVDQIRNFDAEPIVDLIRPQQFMEHQKFLDAGQPYGRNYYWKSDFFDRIDDELIDVAVDHWAQITSPLSSSLIMHLGGAGQARPLDSTAVGFRNTEFVFNMQSAWDGDAGSEEHIGWARAMFDAVHPYSGGSSYINFQTEDEGDERVRQSYPAEIYERLVEVKDRYDPTNMFCFNKNIQPSAAVLRRQRADTSPVSD